MPVNQLIVDTLMLRYPKATAEQIRSKYIQRVNKQKVKDTEVLAGYEYINTLVEANELKGQLVQPSLYQRIGNCRSTQKTINIYNEIETAAKENPNLRLFYISELKKELEQRAKEKPSIKRNFVEYLINNTKNLDDANNARSLVNDFGSKKQKAQFNIIFNQLEKEAKLRADALKQAERASVIFGKEETPIFHSAEESMKVFLENGMVPEKILDKDRNINVLKRRALKQAENRSLAYAGENLPIFHSAEESMNVFLENGMVPEKILDQHRNSFMKRADALKQAEMVSSMIGKKKNVPIFHSAKESMKVFLENGMVPDAVAKTANVAPENKLPAISEAIENVTEEGVNATQKLGKKFLIGAAIVLALGIIIGIIKNNKNKTTENNLNVAA